jgi:monofunctional biosynthetic peptidoglycan transglycosylase
MDKKRIFKKALYSIKIAFVIIVILHAAFFLVVSIYLFLFRTQNPGTTALMDFRKNQYGYTLTSPTFIPLKEIPIDIISTVIFIEDYDFFIHPGIDIESIKLAMEVNQRLGYIAYGGSTLTQQLSRTLLLNPDKNYLRKYLEILTALEMEFILSKERILELYFNYAEWGNNVFGIADASFHHFRKNVQNLSDEEKIILVTLLANPVDYTAETIFENKMLKARYVAVKAFYEEMMKAPPRFKSTIREIQ